MVICGCSGEELTFAERIYFVVGTAIVPVHFPAGRGSAAPNALLAQSAEHSHGKAGVVGSIPTEGSTKLVDPRIGRGQSHGGVAQLVRASGS